MKKYFFLIASVLVMAATSWADEVNPDGTDAWKYLRVTIKQLDVRKLQDSSDIGTWIVVHFGDKEKTIRTSTVTAGADVQFTLKIPKASDGSFRVSYSVSQSWEFSKSWDITQGKLSEGSRDIEIRLKRIDIHNMIVTRPDQSTYIVPNGSVRMTFPDENTGYCYSHCHLEFLTDHGIDVPVGEGYQVHVAARTEDGTDEYDAYLDFRGL